VEHIVVTYLLLALLVPLLCAGCTLLAGRDVSLRNGSVLLCAASLAGALAYAKFQYHNIFGPSPLETAHHVKLLSFGIGSGLTIKLVAEPLGMTFALVAAVLWLANMLYSTGYMARTKDPRPRRFFALLSLSMFCVLGVALAGNLVTLFLFYELLTICTYPLVTHDRNDKALGGGRFYLLELMMSSVSIFLLFILMTLNAAGHTDFASGGILEDTGPAQIFALLALLIYGVVKAAPAPLHSWLPAAMVAPTPVSAFLHAVAVVKVGVFTIIKVMVYTIGLERVKQAFVFDWLFRSNLPLLVACLTTLWATVQAVRQEELKKILAYSTVAQLSYIVGTASLATDMAIRSAAFHIAAHGCAKITMFFAVGAIYTQANVTSYKQMNGLGARMPITMTCFGIAALSLVGIPPTVGYLSKMNLLLSAASSYNLLFMIVIIASTAVTSLYSTRILMASFFSLPSGALTHVKEAPASMLIAMLFMILLIAVLYFAPNAVLLA
jgi:multicomponent Na+:H+ antiporter subunit D